MSCERKIKILQANCGESFVYLKTKFLVIILAVLAVYSYGWKVTEIEMRELFRDFHLVRPLVKELVSPDLFTRKKKMQIVETPFFLSKSHREKTTHDRESRFPMLLSDKSGEIADTLTVSGLNLKPEQTGVLYWVNAIEQEFPLGIFNTDSSGTFKRDISVPVSYTHLTLPTKRIV